MNFEAQILQAIDKIASEKMWDTLEENEVIQLSFNQKEVFCSFLGKNVGYYGIEFFLKEEGKFAMFERMQSIYYPEYIYTYRQNSILIFINAKLEKDKIEKPIIKMYQYHRLPRMISEEEHLEVLEYLGMLYDAVKLMQSKNIYGKFKEGYLLKYFYNYENFQFELAWQEIKLEFKNFLKPINTKKIVGNKNEIEIELDVFPVASSLEHQEDMQYTFFVVEKTKQQLIYHELFLNDHNLFEQVLDQFVSLLEFHGIFKKIYVRDAYMKQFIEKIVSTEVIIDSELNGIDTIIQKYVEED